MPSRFARSRHGGVAPTTSKRPVDGQKARVLAVLSGLSGGEVGGCMEDDTELAARALLATVINGGVTDDEFQEMLSTRSGAVMQAARIQRLCCEPHWGWLPLCIVNPFDGFEGAVTCPMAGLCPVPEGWFF